MSEERFVVGSNEIGEIIVTDVETGNVYRYGDISRFFGLIRLLNEQQATINHLESDKAIAEDYANLFEKENVKLRKQIGEQQSTIQELERKLKKYAKTGEEQLKQIMELQDLCGKSDGENAKLRIENEQLQAQLREKEQDEQLYANEILELREANKEFIQFKELGGDY